MYWFKEDILQTMAMIYPECNMVRKVLNRIEDCTSNPSSWVCYPLLMVDQHILNQLRVHCGPVRAKVLLVLSFGFW